MSITESGIFLIDKEEGISSFKAINRLKRNLQIKKIGHAGTLDPFATGLLVCAVNGATKLLNFAQSGDKIYSGIIKFGIQTDTDDITGEVIQEEEVDLDENMVVENVKKFLGKITQTPPRYSAVKINGVRAYKLARDNKEFEIKSREVEVFNFAISKDLSSKAGDEYSFKIKCSKGTYIRSIARDLGELLNVPACLKTLRREESYPFSVKDAKSLESLANSDILPWEKLFPGIKSLVLDKHMEVHQKVGNLVALSPVLKTIDPSLKQIILKNTLNHPVSLLLREDSVWKFGLNLCQD